MYVLLLLNVVFYDCFNFKYYYILNTVVLLFQVEIEIACVSRVIFISMGYFLIIMLIPVRT